MDHELGRTLRYDSNPDQAIAALIQMLARYPMIWCTPLARSIEAHFEYIAQDARYARSVRDAASRAGGEWKSMLLMQEELSRQQQKCG